MLMEVLDRAGNSAEALRVYNDLRVLLREELGVIPGTETQALHGDILATCDERVELSERDRTKS